MTFHKIYHKADLKTMNDSIYSIITGTGSYIPSKKITNESFLNHEFYDTDGSRLDKTNQEIIDKFEEITTISTRHHISELSPGQNKPGDH